jgi:hypothetical protein
MVFKFNVGFPLNAACQDKTLFFCCLAEMMAIGSFLG